MFFPLRGPRLDYRRFKITSFTSLELTHTALSVPPRSPFLSATVVMWEIRYHISNLSHIYSQYHVMREKVILGHPWPLRGVGGGGTCPAGPPWVRHWTVWSGDLCLSGSIVRKNRFILTKEWRTIGQKSGCLNHSNELIFQVNIQNEM